MTVIDSMNNPFVKHVASLKHKKNRDMLGLFVVEGPNAVFSIPNDWHVECYAVTPQYYKDSQETLSKKLNGIRLNILSERAFSKAADTVNPQGILAVCRKRDYSLETCISGNGILLVCENMSDPGNAGTAIRTAAACGCNAIIFTENSASVYAPKVQRSAAGALFHVPVIECANTAQVLGAVKKEGYRIVAAEVCGGVSLYDTDLVGNICLLIGNEANGLSNNALSFADLRVTIPMAADVESLNASVSCGIILYESFRQRFCLTKSHL